MAEIAFLQDLTIFDPGDDITPLLGTATGAGVPVVPSFSSDPTHPRPYLKVVRGAGGSQVNFRDGTSRVAQVNIDVVDKRQTANDQGTGLFTWLLAAANGDTALLGARCILRQKNPDGSMGTLIDGVIYKVTLNESTYVTYTIMVRDIRERERKARLFSKATSTCIFPLVGPADGYGWNTQWDAATQKYVNIGDPAMPPITGVLCTYATGVFFPLFSNRPKLVEDEVKNWAERTAQLAETWRSHGELVDTGPVGILGTSPHAYLNAIVEWRNPGGAWNVITAPVSTFLNMFGTDMNMFGIDDLKIGPNTYRVLKYIRCEIPAGQPVPGGTVEVRVRSNKAPSEKVPLWIEQNAGEMLRDIGNGTYSPTVNLGPQMRFDTAALTAMIRRTPKFYARITEPVEDAKAWVGPNIYMPLGYAPVIRDGKVYPVSGDLPDASVSLIQLDDSIVFKAGWEHGVDLAVNQVTFEYQRDFVPSDYSTTGKVLTQTVKVERDRVDSQGRHGEKSLVYTPVTVRSIIPLAVGMPPTANASMETGTILALARAEAAIRRFANGAQQVWALCRASMVQSLNIGDWVIMATSWLPDYQTRRRGANRLMQIVNLEKPEPHQVKFTLIDAGPYDQPVPLPTITGTVANADGTVTVSVTGVPTSLPAYLKPRAEVQFAYGATQPATDSGEWKLAGFLDANGSIQTVMHPGGVTVWFRVRGVADGMRPSAWSNPVFLTTPARPGLNDWDLTINPYTATTNPGRPHIAWRSLTGTGGVRVYYERYADGAAVPATTYTHYEDFAASLGESDLSFALLQREQIAIQVEAWTGPTGGSGTAGARSVILTRQRIDRPYVAPKVELVPTETSTTGTLTVTLTDPQNQVQTVEFFTQSGDGLPSPWVVDSSLPYGASVTLVEGKFSWIGYRITALDEDGAPRVIESDVVPFSMGDYPALPDLDVSIDPSTGAATIRWNADSQTQSVRIAYSTSGAPSAATVRAESAQNGRTGSMSAGTVPAGGTLYVGGFAYSGASGGGLESAALSQFASTRPTVTSSVIPPGIRETTSETAVGSTPMQGTLQLDITDPQLRITNIRMRSQVGNTSWTGYTTYGAVTSASYTVNLVEGHISKIEYEVYADLGSGSVLWFRGTVPFSAGSIPTAPAVEASFDGSGNLTVTVTGDSDTKSIRLGASLVNAAAALALANAASPVAGRVVQYTNALTSVSSGTKAYIAAIAYPTNAGTGTASAATQTVKDREGAGTQTPSGTITKKFRVSGSSFQDEFNSGKAQRSIGAGVYNVFGSLPAAPVVTMLAPFQLPPGVTITAFRGQFYSATGSDVISLYLYQVVGDGTTNFIASLSPASGSGNVPASATFSYGPVGDQPFVVRLVMNGSSSTTDTMRCYWFEIEYTMPSYDKTI